MNVSKLDTIEQIKEFLEGTAEVAFSNPTDVAALRSFIATVLNAAAERRGQNDGVKSQYCSFNDFPVTMRSPNRRSESWRGRKRYWAQAHG